MTWLYILSGLVAAGLLVFLIAALLNPEDFSRTRIHGLFLAFF